MLCDCWSCWKRTGIFKSNKTSDISRRVYPVRHWCFNGDLRRSPIALWFPGSARVQSKFVVIAGQDPGRTWKNFFRLGKHRCWKKQKPNIPLSAKEWCRIKFFYNAKQVEVFWSRSCPGTLSCQPGVFTAELCAGETPGFHSTHPVWALASHILLFLFHRTTHWNIHNLQNHLPTAIFCLQDYDAYNWSFEK